MPHDGNYVGFSEAFGGGADLPTTTFVHLPPCFINEAGRIQNLVEHEAGGVAIIESKADTWRSNHWHKTDWHYLYVVTGVMHYWERPVGSNEKPRHSIVGAGDMIFTPPMVEHSTWFPCATTVLSVSKLSRRHDDHEQDVVRLDEPLVKEHP